MLEGRAEETRLSRNRDDDPTVRRCEAGGRLYDEDMHPLDTLALVGEVLSWIGLGIGLPLLLVAMLVRVVEGPWLPIEIAVVERDGALLARWFAGDHFRERRLRRSEPPTVGWTTGVVSGNDPMRARIGEPPHFRRVVRTLGIVFTAVGALGLIVSLVPLFL